MKTAEKVLTQIRSYKQRGKTKLVAIDGLGGSGKTTFVRKLVALDNEIKVLELDHFPCLPEENPYHQLGRKLE